MTKSLRHLEFVFLCVLSLILWWHPLVSTMGLALRKDEYTHILLILPVSAALIYREWRANNPRPDPNFRTGSALLFVAVRPIATKNRKEFPCLSERTIWATRDEYSTPWPTAGPFRWNFRTHSGRRDSACLWIASEFR